MEAGEDRNNMKKRYYIELSRKDTGLVSYFPGLELRDDMNYDWIDDVLVPAIKPIAKRTSKKIQEMPITFWTCVRGTARRRAEIFLFVTPAYPGKLIEDALVKALTPFSQGKIHAAREPIPDYAFPCIQVFRGKLIRFYQTHKALERGLLPRIKWKDNFPEIEIVPDYGITDLYEELGLMPVEARIYDISNGESMRKFQQALTPVALEIKERDVVLPKGSRWMEDPDHAKKLMNRSVERSVRCYT
ncbi:hypothetical protein ACFLX1_02445, partial [Chloroflexota bacterium]